MNRKYFGSLSIALFSLTLLLNLWLKIFPEGTNKTLMIFILIFSFMLIVRQKEQRIS
jgi:hypothetical protein